MNRKRAWLEFEFLFEANCRNCCVDWIGKWCQTTRNGLDLKGSNRILSIAILRAELSRGSVRGIQGVLVLGIGLLAFCLDCSSIQLEGVWLTLVPLIVLMLFRKGRVWSGPLGVSSYLCHWWRKWTWFPVTIFFLRLSRQLVLPGSNCTIPIPVKSPPVTQVVIEGELEPPLVDDSCTLMDQDSLPHGSNIVTLDPYSGSEPPKNLCPSKSKAPTWKRLTMDNIQPSPG